MTDLDFQPETAATCFDVADAGATHGGNVVPLIYHTSQQ